MAAQDAVAEIDDLRADRHDHLPAHALAIGIAIGALLGVLNILVLFRAGTAFGGSALVALLGAAALRLFGKVRWETLFVVFSVASSGYFATAAIDSGAAAVVLGGHRLPAWPVLLGLALVANLLGIGLGLLVGDRYLSNPDLTYPTLRPATQLLDVLTRTNRRIAGPLLAGTAVAAVLAGIEQVAGTSTIPLAPNAPQWLSLSLSPLLFGVGLLVGGRMARWLALGMAYSVIVWLCQPAPGYDEHISSAWILPAAVGLMMGVALTTLVRDRKQLVNGLAGPRSDATGTAAMVFRGTVTLAAISGTALLIWRAGLVRGLLLAATLIALTAFAVVFMNRAGGEVGIVPLAPVVYTCLLILLLLGAGATWSLLASATVAGAGVSCVYLIYSRRIGAGAPLDAAPTLRTITLTQLIGGVTGSIAGVLFITAAARAHLIGSVSMPAPTANTIGFVASRFRDLGATALLVLAGAAATGVGSVAMGVMPSSVGLGMLLPPAATLALIAGGLAREAIKRRRPGWNENTDIVASGLIIGEGLVSVVVLGARLWPGAR